MFAVFFLFAVWTWIFAAGLRSVVGVAAFPQSPSQSYPLPPDTRTLYPKFAGPSEFLRERMATVGIHLVYHGETFPFSSYYDHVFVIPAPEEKEYLELVDSLQETCSSIDMAGFSHVTTSDSSFDKSVAFFLKEQLVERC